VVRILVVSRATPKLGGRRPPQRAAWCSASQHVAVSLLVARCPSEAEGKLTAKWPKQREAPLAELSLRVCVLTAVDCYTLRRLRARHLPVSALERYRPGRRSEPEAEPLLLNVSTGIEASQKPPVWPSRAIEIPIGRDAVGTLDERLKIFR
jgi:hypothetical protein